VPLLQPEQGTLADEAGMIRTQMESTIDKKMVAVAWDGLYDTTLLTVTSNQYFPVYAYA
jgi:hypothetical protein